MRILFIGDIVGKPGREIVASAVPKLRAAHGLDFVIANGENAAAGAGITSLIAGTLLESGVDAITLGDHVWDQKGFETDIVGLAKVCRPANLPAGNPGRDLRGRVAVAKVPRVALGKAGDALHGRGGRVEDRGAVGR